MESFFGQCRINHSEPPKKRPHVERGIKKPVGSSALSAAAPLKKKSLKWNSDGFERKTALAFRFVEWYKKLLNEITFVYMHLENNL